MNTRVDPMEKRNPTTVALSNNLKDAVDAYKESEGLRSFSDAVSMLISDALTAKGYK